MVPQERVMVIKQRDLELQVLGNMLCVYHTITYVYIWQYTHIYIMYYIIIYIYIYHYQYVGM